MTVVILDLDCIFLQENKHFKKIVKQQPCQVEQLNEDGSIRWEGTPGSINRFILVTKFANGIAKRHRVMLSSLSGRWAACVMDMQGKGNQKQIGDAFAALAANTGKNCPILFDTSDEQKELEQLLKENPPEKPSCLILHRKNQALAEKVKEVLAIRRPAWEITVSEDGKNINPHYLDLILIVGKEGNDFCIPVLESQPKNLYLWLEIPIGSNGTQVWEEHQHMIFNRLKDSGWNYTHSDKYVMAGVIDYEERLAQVESGETTFAALDSDEGFVLWDDYGLPLTNAEDGEQKIEQFLHKLCVLNLKIPQKLFD